MKTRYYTLLLALFINIIFTLSSAFAEFNPIELLSSRSTGAAGDRASTESKISHTDDGRFVVFESLASDLITGDTISVSDIFIADRLDSEGLLIERISVSTSGGQSNGGSFLPSVSADGNLVVFASDATNLVTGDTNSTRDIFLHNRTTNVTSRISVSSAAIQANGRSDYPVISADGTRVVYRSSATNLVAGDTNGVDDIFVYTIAGQTTTRISVSSGAVQGNEASGLADISDDGTLVVYDSAANNLVAGDTNSASDIFLYDFNDQTTTLISKKLGGGASNGASTAAKLSGDGAVVTYQSSATDLVIEDLNSATDIFVYDIIEDSTLRITGINSEEPDALSINPAINSDGSFIVFQSLATNLVANDKNNAADIFGYDRQNETLTRISVSEVGKELPALSIKPDINSNGQYVSFSSLEDDLASSDLNQATDVFIINTQCLLKPTGVTPEDQDEDGTDDCDDLCPLDPVKIVVGTCGCGVSDVDTDSDGTPDCNDACPTDPEKSSEVGCGCGVPEDENDNDIPDCLEPNTSTKPSKPTLTYRKKRDTLVVFMQSEYIASRFQVQVNRDGNRLITKRSKKATARIPLRGNKGNLQVRYRYVLGGGKFSKFSRLAKINVK